MPLPLTPMRPTRSVSFRPSEIFSKRVRSANDLVRFSAVRIIMRGIIARARGSESVQGAEGGLREYYVNQGLPKPTFKSDRGRP